MKSILISMIFLIYIPSVLYAQSLSNGDRVVYDSEYSKKIQINAGSPEDAKNLFIDISSLENSDFEVKFSANKCFKPFIIMGAKISELFSGFSLRDLGIGVGANIHISESFSYYAKYSSATTKAKSLVAIDSSSMYLGIEYSF